MLDTNICSYVMRNRPEAVLARLEHAVGQQHQIVISVITYAELRFGATSLRASPRITPMVDEFVRRLDDILPWDAAAVDETVQLRSYLATQGTPIGHNDAAIAGHALAAACTLITHNTREFSRIPNLRVEDWAVSAACGTSSARRPAG